MGQIKNIKLHIVTDIKAVKMAKKESDDECEVAYIMDEEEDEDEDDDDYVPGKRDSDSDPDYGKKPKKAKTTPKKAYVPGRRGRPPSASKPPSGRSRGRPRKDQSAVKATDDADEVTDNDTTPKKKAGTKRKSPSTPATKSPKAAKLPSVKSPKTKAPRPKKQKKSSCSDDMDESSFQRRSSRSSTSRAISYADADLSEEDMFEDEDLMEAFRRSKEDSKKDAAKKQHVDELWSKFKTDVDDKGKTKEKTPGSKPGAESTAIPATIRENGKSSVSKNEKEKECKNEKKE